MSTNLIGFRRAEIRQLEDGTFQPMLFVETPFLKPSYVYPAISSMKEGRQLLITSCRFYNIATPLLHTKVVGSDADGIPVLEALKTEHNVLGQQKRLTRSQKRYG